MKVKTLQFILLHFTLLLGGLIFENLLYFFVASALAGILPRGYRSFGYYWLLALAAIALAFILQPPHSALNHKLAQLLELGPVPFWAIVALVSSLAMAFTATGVNRLLGKDLRRTQRSWRR